MISEVSNLPITNSLISFFKSPKKYGYTIYLFVFVFIFNSKDKVNKK